MPQQGQRPAEFSPQELAQYCESVRRTWARRTGDGMLAEDLAQQTALVALERLHRAPLEEPEKLGAFMHQTAKNLHIAHQRKLARRRTSLADVDIYGDDAGNPEHLQLVAERRSWLIRLLARLRIERDRDLLTRVLVYRHNKAEVCRAMDLSGAHFDRVFARARHRLSQAARRVGAGEELP